ncbi:MAG: ArsA family ATPase [Vicinamibacterales bacterium]
MLLNQPVLSALLDRRVIFVGGKGGVGKTTIAASLAVEAAERGRRVLVVSTDPAHSLGDVFGRDIGPSDRMLSANLWGREIDGEEEAGRHIATVKQQMKSLVHPRMYDEVERQLDLARFAPGTEEAALLERMAELMGEVGARIDLLIFDTAPTGHTLRLLSLPEIMTAWTDGLLRHRERSSKFGDMLKRIGGPPRGDEQTLLGSPADYPEDARAERINELLLARQRKLRRAREILLDRAATGFVLVLNPDRLSLLESQKALQSLERADIPVAAVVVNRVLPEDAGGGEFLDARRRQEAAYLGEIDASFPRLPRIVLPLMPGDVHGLEALGRIGQRLTR